MRYLLALLCLLSLTYAIPYIDKVALANSLNFGKSSENWQCKVCDKTNRPKNFKFIHQKL